MIVSVLFLIGLFLCISAYLILTGLNFIGLSYLLVYVGAVTVRMNNFAALVRIQLYKVLLIIKNFLFKTMFYKNKLPCLKFKRATRLAFAYIFSSYFEYSKYVEKIKQRKSHFSQKSFSNHSEEFIK